MALRIGSLFLLIFSIVFFPFWVAVILGISMLAYFPVCIEVVIVFFLLDLIYGVPEVRFYGITYVSLLGASITLLFVEFLKKKLKYYPEH